jgi:hypothetical protein
VPQPPFQFNDATPGARRSGFGRLELVMTLAALTLLTAVALPLLAQNRSRSDLAICMSNLGQVGKGILSWNADNSNYDPWRTPSVFTRQHSSGLLNNAWFWFSVISNELRTPTVLACPADAQVIRASNFGGLPDGGFLDPGYRNGSISYFISLDSIPLIPQTILSGDRHVQMAQGFGSCALGLSPINSLIPGSTGWRPAEIHGPAGNLLFHDGRVETRSSAGVRQAFGAIADPRLQDTPGSWHILTSRFF